MSDMNQQSNLTNQNSRGIGTRNNVSVIQRIEYNGVTAEILEYQKLLGSQSPNAASTLWFMEQQNIQVRQIALYIQNDSVQIEAGAMSYFQGPLEMVSGLTVGNAVGKMFKASVTGETAAKPIYRGSGVLVLEPSFRHFIPFVLGQGEQIIVDKGMFYVASESVKVEPSMQKNLSSGLLGGEGLFQMSLTGPGLVILESSVPMCEVDIINLQNDVLRVDGNFALLRTGHIDFTVERSAKTLVGSAASGEGLVNVYRGTGQIWLAPTIKVYEMMGILK